MEKNVRMENEVDTRAIGVISRINPLRLTLKPLLQGLNIPTAFWYAPVGVFDIRWVGLPPHA